MNSINRSGILAQLQSDILRLEGVKPANQTPNIDSLGPLIEAFPDSVFPRGAMHEFFAATPEDRAATTGFMTGLLTSLTGNTGTVLWISSCRRLFPPSLSACGLQPEKFVFIDLHRERDILWAMDEALKCAALSTVVVELNTLSFTASRRLQLSVERSKVTGFILRQDLLKAGTTASLSRWKISSLPSEAIGDLPGIGFPKWKVELTKIRNGKPGTWDIVWQEGKFRKAMASVLQPLYEGRQKAG